MQGIACGMESAMKKMLYAAIILWIAVTGIYLSQRGSDRKVSMSAVFTDCIADREWCELNTYIEGYGKFGVCYLTEQEKENLVKNVAAALGITSPCSISTAYSSRGVKDGTSEGNAVDIMTTILEKDSINGKVIVKAITEERMNENSNYTATQYVYVKITAYNNIDCAADYRELVEGMFDTMGIEGNVNMNLEGSIAGALNSSEKNELADNILKRLSAQVVAENRDSDIFTIYAYAKGAGSYITIGESKINMNIAIGYDEELGRTNVYLSSPVSSLDY